MILPERTLRKIELWRIVFRRRHKVIEPTAAEAFMLAFADQGEQRLVAEGHRAVGVEPNRDQPGAFERLAKSPLAFTQGGLGPAASRSRRGQVRA